MRVRPLRMRREFSKLHENPIVILTAAELRAFAVQRDGDG
jgi:hypothetical protein